MGERGGGTSCLVVNIGTKTETQTTGLPYCLDHSSATHLLDSLVIVNSILKLHESFLYSDLDLE